MDLTMKRKIDIYFMVMEEGSGSNDHIDHPKAFFIFHNIRHVLPDYWVSTFQFFFFFFLSKIIVS